MNASEHIEAAQKRLEPDASSGGKLFQVDIEEAKARAAIATAISLESISRILGEILLNPLRPL
jgi:hypothetical protein